MKEELEKEFDDIRSINYLAKEMIKEDKQLLKECAYKLKTKKLLQLLRKNPAYFTIELNSPDNNSAILVGLKWLDPYYGLHIPKKYLSVEDFKLVMGVHRLQVIGEMS